MWCKSETKIRCFYGYFKNSTKAPNDFIYFSLFWLYIKPLSFNKLCEISAFFDQLIITAVLNDLSVIEKQYAVTVLNSWQSVGDHNPAGCSWPSRPPAPAGAWSVLFSPDVKPSIQAYSLITSVIKRTRRPQRDTPPATSSSSSSSSSVISDTALSVFSFLLASFPLVSFPVSDY